MAGTLALPALAAEHLDVGAPDKAAFERVHPTRPGYSLYAGRTFPTRPLFGDTHLHTSYSMDAGAFGAKLGPKGAYRFARGDEGIAPGAGKVFMFAPARRARDGVDAVSKPSMVVHRESSFNMKGMIVSLTMTKWIAALAVAVAASAAMAQSIVDLDHVREAVARGALVWDVRDAGGYAKGHIPGAVNFGDPAVVLRNPYTEDYLPIADLEKALGAAGIDPAREIVVYGDRGLPSAYFALVTLRYFVATNARVFHDGIDAWVAGKQPVSTKPDKAKPRALKLVPQPGVIVESKAVVAALKRGDVQSLDVRSVKEFRGEDVRAIRGGRIPGAINVPYEQNWVDPETRGKLKSGAVKDSAGKALKPRDQLAALYAKLDPAKEVHVYCQSGSRASQTAVVLGDLGFKNVKVYDASWLGYSSWLSAPAEDEVWRNFGGLLPALKGLEDRYGALLEAKRPQDVK